MPRTFRRRLLPLLTSLLGAATVAQAVPAPAALDLHGRVHDELGRGVPAARVEALHGERVLRRTHSDATGRFLLPALPEGALQLRVGAPGKAQRRLVHALFPGRQVAIVDLYDAARLAGVVRDADGVPVADVMVLLFVDVMSEVRTDAAGRFTFPAERVGPALLRAYGPRSFAETKVCLGMQEHVELRLPRTGIHSRVVRVRGLPDDARDRAQVHVLSMDGVLSSGSAGVPLAADGTAKVRIGSTSLVQLVAPGFAFRPVGALVENAANHAIEFEARAMPAAARPRTVLRGTAIDEREKPVVGLHLRVQTFDDRVVGRGVVDARGQFQIEVDLPAEQQCRLSVQRGTWWMHDARVTARGHDCEVILPNAGTSGYVVELERAGAMAMRIAAAQGRRPELQPVEVVTAESAWSGLLTVFTDVGGRLELPGLPADEYVLRTCTDDGELLWARAFVRAGRVLEEVEWRREAGAVLEGRLLDSRGRPAAGARLRLWQADRPESMEAMGAAFCVVRTDRDGRFRRVALPPGTWRVALEEGTFGGASLTVATAELGAGTTVRLDLQLEPAAR